MGQIEKNFCVSYEDEIFNALKIEIMTSMRGWSKWRKNTEKKIVCSLKGLHRKIIFSYWKFFSRFLIICVVAVQKIKFSPTQFFTSQ
jgi:hypothetical protein